MEMTLQELIDAYEFEDIEDTFKSLYDEKYIRNSVGYEEVFEILKDIDDVILSDYSILIEHIVEADSDWHQVCGQSIGSDATYSLSFTPWKEWLGMVLNPLTLENYSGREILCHCLWEMTYWGFTETKIQKTLSEIENSIDNEELECMDEEADSLDILERLLKDEIESSSDDE